MSSDRREFIQRAMVGAALYGSAQMRAAQSAALGIPGPWPGRVVQVHDPSSVAQFKPNREAIRRMLAKGMMELTGAPDATSAWRAFFDSSDVVGLKLNPVGRPHVISSPEMVQEIIAGLESAGVKRTNIIAYDRYKREFLQAGFDKWLPEGVRWTYGTDQPHPLQLDMDMYDAKEYVELPLVLPRADATNPHHRRSYLAKFITQDVTKMVNLALLKHHQSAGVTVALKNLSHGLVNNVSRSHSTPTLNTCGTFIPSIVDHPIIRKKSVINILDGLVGGYHGGPGGKIGKYMWEHKTMYFSTDPVAMDKVAWKAIDAQRAAVGMKSIAEGKPDPDSTFLNMQVEHIEIAGALGLGVYQDQKIDLRKFDLA